MKNYVQKGRVVAVAMPYDRLAGQGVLVGSIFGVCANDALSGVSSSVQVRGVFDVTKDTSTFSQGDKVYWDDSAKKCSSTSTSNVVVGYATQAQLTGDATVRVSLMHANRSAADVATVSAAAAATAGGSSPSAAQVDAGVAAAIAPLTVGINAILTALKGAGLMK